MVKYTLGQSVIYKTQTGKTKKGVITAIFPDSTMHINEKTTYRVEYFLDHQSIGYYQDELIGEL